MVVHVPMPELHGIAVACRACWRVVGVQNDQFRVGFGPIRRAATAAPIGGSRAFHQLQLAADCGSGMRAWSVLNR